MLYHAREVMHDRRTRPPLTRAERGGLVAAWLLLAVISLAAIAGSRRVSVYDEATVIVGPCQRAQVDE